MKKGKVYIIGAGPGDYKLMTLKAAECISQAEVIVYDRLVSSKVLKYARRDAELVYVGKMPDYHATPQEKINEILVDRALKGKTVARIKGGDPFVFGRGGEEAEALADKGIGFEVIPGITSAVSVPAYAGIPVTHRELCSSVHIITGHERPDKSSSFVDYEVLAKTAGTLVFLMGVKNLKDICSNLIKNGRDGSTPAAVIEKGTTFDQRVVIGNLTDIAEKVHNEGIQSPAVTVIGEVVSLREKLEWLSQRPLSGKRIIVTRAREQASSLVEKIEALGGEAVEFPVIKISEPENMGDFDRALKYIKDYKWLIFTSVNGVNAFFTRLRQKGMDIRELSGTRLCAIGEATSEELNRLGLNVDYCPDKFTTDALLDGLLSRIGPGEKALLARADIAGKELPDGLRKNRIDFDDIVVYRTVMDTESGEEILEMLEQDKADYITFTSSSTVRNFISVIGKENIAKAQKLRIACIGPVTADTVHEFGLKPDIVADTYTIEGLMEKLVEDSETEADK